MGSKVTATLAGISTLFLPGMAAGAYQLNLPAPQSSIAAEMYDLHTMLLWICLVIFVAVFGVMLYSVINHRKSSGYKAATFHHSTKAEVIWTIIPFLILIGMGYPATQTIIDMKDTSDPDITIKATGYQWQWGYDYLKGEGEGLSFYSKMSTPREQIRNEAPKGENYLLEVDNNMVVPVGKKIRMLLTAGDVIHAWSVQELGVKQDAVPGFIR
ncbi:MAG: cytochrome c oxidase subunit II transmembrane domain-containing protein, partial [Pseudomonadales bacterium]